MSDIYKYCDKALDRLEGLKGLLFWMATFENSKGQMSSINLVQREIQGCSVVAMSAEIESFLKDSLWYIYKKIADESVALSKLSPGLRAIHLDFKRDRMRWEDKIKIFEIADSETPFSIPEGSNSNRAAPPLGMGQTINSRNLGLVFRFLGIDKSRVFYDTSDKIPGAIKVVASARNEVAHGNSLRVVFPADREELSISKLIEYVQIYINQINYMTDVFSDYVDNKKYLCC